MSGTSPATGAFYVSNGQIIGPNGTPFIAKGIDIFDYQTTAMGSSAGSEITGDFPNINMVRLAVQNYANVAALSSFISQMTGDHVVVEIEDHSPPFGSNNVLTGSALTNELAWYSSLASTYKSDPYVWFGTANEPNETSNLPAVSNQEVSIYNTIRATGNTNPIMVEQIAGYTDTGLTASAYANMTNIIWDTHYYGWVSNFSTDIPTITADLNAQVANAQTIKSADGVVPVIIGEYGISSTGYGADPNGTQVVTAVDASPYGSLAWAWSAGTDSLTNADGSLSSFGTQVAQYIATATPTPVPSAPASPNDTVVKAGSTAAIVDASGNKWTITSAGLVAVNGVADTTTANVVELAYVNGTIWQENTSNLWWGETKPNASWAPAAGTATSPLPATPTPTPTPTLAPSPNDTVVKAGSSAAIVDASGNQWTITSTGVVAINGVADTTTTNVVELAYVNGTIWQENTSNLWWGETKPNASWAPAAGTATSPLPATPTPTPTPAPTPSPNDTVVKAGSNAAIVDASGNKWTITAAGLVAVNGVADTTTANVVEVAYVSGTIWQENTSNLWWGETKPNASWAPTAGTATSPLPATPTPTPTPMPSPNDTVVKAGSSAVIVDAGGNEWTITSAGLVAVNGVADTTTANVAELAYVNGAVWQENTNNLWWSKTSPTTAWSPAAGTATSPLPSAITISPNQASATVSLSQISVVATSGNHTVFITGTNDTVTLSGGTNTITDTGKSNTYVIPAAGDGYDSFTSNILTAGATLDLRTALAATNWSGVTSDLTKYLSVLDTNQAAVLSISPTPGGTAVAIATVNGATTATLSTWLAHALT